MMPNDPILTAFLNAQEQEARSLNRQSELVHVTPVHFGDGPASRYLVELRCKGLVREPGGEIREHEKFVFGIHFLHRYLKKDFGDWDEANVASLRGPYNVWHPNIAPPFVCLGKSKKAPLTELVHRLWDVTTFANYATHDGMNQAACQWVRNQNEFQFPLDHRPMRSPTASEGTDIK